MIRESCTENCECFLTGFLKCRQKKNVKLTVTRVLTKTTNIGFILVTKNEVNELILIAKNNSQKLKQFIRS